MYFSLAQSGNPQPKTPLRVSVERGSESKRPIDEEESHNEEEEDEEEEDEEENEEDEEDEYHPSSDNEEDYTMQPPKSKTISCTLAHPC